MTIKHKILSILCIIFSLLVCMVLFLSMTGFPFQDLLHGEQIHAKAAYAANWGVYIRDQSAELFYAESDHDAFGEGERYSVLTAPFEERVLGIGASGNDSQADSITYTHGVHSDEEIQQFFSYVWEYLSVPEEYQCSLDDAMWQRLTKEDGSAMVIVTLSSENTVYIAEELF